MSEKPFDQDDDNERMIPFEIPTPESLQNIFQVMSYMIENDKKEDSLNDTVRDIVPIMSYIQQFMGWDLEILVEQADVEDFLMKKYSLFDNDMWKKVLNTKAINELHQAVFRLSQTYLSDAVAEVLMTEELHRFPEDDPLG